MRERVINGLLAFTIVATFTFMAYLAPGCAGLKKVLRTADDIADAACELFGTENPEEFEQHVRTALPPGAALDEAEESGFDPSILCSIKEVVQPFIDDQLRLQQSTKASLRAGMNDGATTE